MGRRRHGAGILPLDRTTGSILIARRAPWLPSEPGTWDAFGGSAEKGDTSPLDTARREFVEETGYVGAIEIFPGPIVRKGESVGVMFIGVVPHEFEPALSEEHDDYMWVFPGALQPTNQLHWPLREFLRQKPRPGELRGRRLLEALRKAQR